MQRESGRHDDSATWERRSVLRAAVRRAALAAGCPTVLSYDVDSRDFTDPGVAAIRRNVAAATAGGVVSLHLGHPGTLDALPAVLDDLGSRGLRPVTASALFS